MPNDNMQNLQSNDAQQTNQILNRPSPMLSPKVQPRSSLVLKLYVGLFLLIAVSGGYLAYGKYIQSSNKLININKIHNYPIVSKATMKENCKPLIDLSGSTNVEKIKYWFDHSGCFSPEYVSENIQNIRQDKTIPGYVYYDVYSNGEIINKMGGGWSGRFSLVDGKIFNIYGPLREYKVNISREAALNEVAENKWINTRSSDLTEFLELKNDDEYNEQDGYKFGISGLTWKIPTKCFGSELAVDAMNGDIFQKSGCEHQI